MSIRTSFLTSGALFFFFAAFASAQQELAKVDVHRVTALSQKTPDFEVGSGIKDVRDDRKDWLQILVNFTAKSTSREDFVGNVEVRYFVLPASAQKNYKKLYTAVVNHVDVLKDSPLHSAVFFSPNSIARIYGKSKSPNPGDLMVAVEVWVGGKMVGFKISDKESTKWWRRDDVPKDNEMLRPKHKTPFRNLWYDSFAEVRD